MGGKKTKRGGREERGWNKGDRRRKARDRDNEAEGEIKEENRRGEMKSKR